MEHHFKARFEQALENSLGPFQKDVPLLKRAMRHALCTPGKRIRPWLLLQSAMAAIPSLTFAKAWHLCLPSMLAVEYIHAYSLVHDDLPAMDNDYMRRGKPSCHAAFGETTAILAGDALLSDAFFHLSTSKQQALKQCQELALAIGSQGMALGQFEDLQHQKGLLDCPMHRIHQLKTARLFAASCVLGGLCADAQPKELETLRVFGNAFGMAFQYADDATDCPTHREELQILAKEHLLQAHSSIAHWSSHAKGLFQLCISNRHSTHLL